MISVSPPHFVYGRLPRRLVMSRPLVLNLDDDSFEVTKQLTTWGYTQVAQVAHTITGDSYHVLERSE